jgi:hypothetical protein
MERDGARTPSLFSSKVPLAAALASERMAERVRVPATPMLHRAEADVHDRDNGGAAEHEPEQVCGRGGVPEVALCTEVEERPEELCDCHRYDVPNRVSL